MAVCGSTQPSSPTQTPPCRDSGLACGITLEGLLGAETTSTSRPIPRARLAPRRSSTRLSLLEAIRRLPTVSNTPSSS